jgi:hypothetical protein
MHRIWSSALLAAGLTVLLALPPRQASAQTVSQTANGAINSPASSNTSSKQTQTIAKQTPQCVHIINECKKLGFIPGQYQKDNGLWKDCFDPVVYGKGHPTRDGSPITVPVSPADQQACHAAVVGKT